MFQIRLLYLSLFLMCFFPLHALADTPVGEHSSDLRYSCDLAGSNDQFELYPEQVTYRSRQFAHFQMIGGLSVIVLNLQTLRFNRMGNLNLLSSSTLDPDLPPEPLQLLGGSCHPIPLHPND